MRASAAGGFGPPMAAPSNLRVCDDARHPADGGEVATVRQRIAARAPARDFRSARSRAEGLARAFGEWQPSARGGCGLPTAATSILRVRRRRREGIERPAARFAVRRMGRRRTARADARTRSSQRLRKTANGGGARHALGLQLAKGTPVCQNCGPKAGRSCGPPTSARSKPFGNELQPADPLAGIETVATGPQPSGAACDERPREAALRPRAAAGCRADARTRPDRACERPPTAPAPMPRNNTDRT